MKETARKRGVIKTAPGITGEKCSIHFDCSCNQMKTCSWVVKKERHWVEIWRPINRCLQRTNRHSIADGNHSNVTRYLKKSTNADSTANKSHPVWCLRHNSEEEMTNRPLKDCRNKS